MELARALHLNCTLTTLFLSNNQLGSETATLLGQALASKSSALTFLDLSWNMIKVRCCWNMMKLRFCLEVLPGRWAAWSARHRTALFAQLQ